MYVLAGFALAMMFGIEAIANQQWYTLSVGALLAIGLYGSTYGIDLDEARLHFKLIVKAVTVGVLAKALIVGAVMALVFQDVFGFLLGVLVAQIDPLSTASLLRGGRMSKRAKTILAAWASFDDPMTVLLALYIPAALAVFWGDQFFVLQDAPSVQGFAGYLMGLGINLAFAGSLFVVWRLLQRSRRTSRTVVASVGVLGMYGLVVGALSVAVYFFWMLGVALMGLFMRPGIDKLLDRAVTGALSVAGIVLGILLVGGVSIWRGIVLGMAAYGAQVIVGLLLTRDLPARDRWHIAFAQQNGITAIILALLLEPVYPGTVAIVAPAIAVVNCLHVLANWLLDRRR